MYLLCEQLHLCGYNWFCYSKNFAARKFLFLVAYVWVVFARIDLTHRLWETISEVLFIDGGYEVFESGPSINSSEPCKRSQGNNNLGAVKKIQRYNGDSCCFHKSQMNTRPNSKLFNPTFRKCFKNRLSYNKDQFILAIRGVFMLTRCLLIYHLNLASILFLNIAPYLCSYECV